LDHIHNRFIAPSTSCVVDDDDDGVVDDDNIGSFGDVGTFRRKPGKNVVL